MVCIAPKYSSSPHRKHTDILSLPPTTVIKSRNSYPYLNMNGIEKKQLVWIITGMSMLARVYDSGLRVTHSRPSVRNFVRVRAPPRHLCPLSRGSGHRNRAIFAKARYRTRIVQSFRLREGELTDTRVGYHRRRGRFEREGKPRGHFLGSNRRFSQ